MVFQRSFSDAPDGIDCAAACVAVIRIPAVIATVACRVKRILVLCKCLGSAHLCLIIRS